MDLELVRRKLFRFHFIAIQSNGYGYVSSSTSPFHSLKIFLSLHPIIIVQLKKLDSAYICFLMFTLIFEEEKETSQKMTERYWISLHDLIDNLLLEWFDSIRCLISRKMF